MANKSLLVNRGLLGGVKNAFLDKVREDAKKEIAGLNRNEICARFEKMLNDMDNHRGDQAFMVKYEEYWNANAKDDPKGHWSDKDQVQYPRFGHLSGSFFDPLNWISNSINKLKGVSSGTNCLYGDCGTWHGGRAWWGINFESIAAYQHFLWAGCYRYFPLSHNEDWLLTVDDGDPDYSKTDKIKMQLEYMNHDKVRAEWEKDWKDFADGIEKYANSQYNV